MPTLQELIAQQTALTAQIAEYERPLVQAAQDMLTAPGVTELAAALSAIRDELPEGQAKIHIGNVLTVITAVPQVLAQELVRLNAVTGAF